MLYETFWSAFSLNWKILLKAVCSSLSGTVCLKNFLYKYSDIDVKTLPYSQCVLKYIKSQRSEFKKIILVTGSNEAIAKRISNHLRLFDGVHGSKGKLNLKGKNKAKFLNDKYGINNYDYLGNSNSDLHIWKTCNKAITHNASKTLRRKCETINKNYQHLQSASFYRSTFGYIKAIRPHQWLKNLLVFLPILAAHQLSIQQFSSNAVAFISFCLVASSVYICNDLLDLKADRKHPRKRYRPFATGTTTICGGMILSTLMLIFSLTVSFIYSWDLLIIILIYYLSSSLYSMLFKRKIIIDIITLAFLYTLRIIAGGVSADIKISLWLFAFSIFIFLSLAAVKRQAELVDLKRRKELHTEGRGYKVKDLTLITIVAIGSGFISVLVLALYVLSPEVLLLYQTPWALGGVCCILFYWLMRMIYIAHRGRMHDDPIIYAAQDWTSRYAILAIGALVFAATKL